MKFKKRILSILLVLCMVLSMLPAIGLTASAATGDYELVTDASTLKVGDSIVIVASASNYTLGTTQNTNNRNAVLVTKGDGTVTIGDTVQVLRLTEGTVSGTFGLSTGNGYLYAASSSNNYLKTQTTNNANGSWTITITSAGIATIKAQGSNTRNLLKYNSSSKLFSCYSSGQADVSIYKLNSSAASYTVTASASPAEGGTVTVSGNTITATPNAGYYVTGEYVAGTGITVSYNNNNTFTFSATASGNVEIKFAAKTAATLTYSENGTTHNASGTYYVGDTVTLESPTVSTIDDYSFIGWSTQTVSATDTRPTIISELTLTAEAQTVYAVYAKQSTVTTSGDYVLVESALTNYAGDYLIVYNNQYALKTHYGNQNANTYATYQDISGYYTAGTKSIASNTTTDALVYTAAKTTNGYSLYSVTDKSYLGYNNTGTGSTLRWDTTYTASVNEWTLGVNSIVSVYDSTKAIRWNSGSPRFAIYAKTGQQEIQLFKKSSGTVTTYSGYTTSPVVDVSLPCTVNIRCGKGEVSMLKNGEVIASTNTAGTPDKTYVSTGDEITLVMKPGDGYRLATAEKGSFRIYDSTTAPANAKYAWTWDETYGGYIFEYTVEETNPQDNSSNYYNVSFLPRRMDTGITAVQATGLESGLYVITGVPYAQNTAPGADTCNNLHDAANTYLLFGDDSLAGDVVGRKSAAMRLSDINVTLNSTSPYQMSGLNEACLYEIKAGTGSYAGYYTIRMCGATSDLYLTCTGNSSDKLAATALTDTATASSYWTITIDSNGVAKIQNKAQTTRFLKFAGDGNYQFRTYTETTNGSVWPVLYKATQSAYTVSYSKEGSGTVKAYNTTTGSDVVSGSVQSAGSSIRFTFTPATNYELQSVKVNGELVSLTYDGITDSYSYTYSGLNRHITVTASFEMINSSIVVEYYVNNTMMTQESVKFEGEYYYVDLTPSVTIEGSSQNYTYADLSFDKAANGAMEFTDVNDPIPVKSGDTVKLYFLTTAVSMSKTATETTKYVNSDTNAMPLGGTAADSNKAFTDANGQDSYDNVKQTFEITLDVNSTDMIKGYSEGGNTDIILVLDDSNSMHPNYSTNADLTKKAISEFLDIAFTTDSGNKVAVVRYNSLAGAWNGSTFVQCNGSTSGYSGITYENCFMSTKTAVTTAVNVALTKDESNGGTNMEGGFMMAEVVAKTRATSTDRDLLILIFTDGEPTFRYSDGSTVSYDSDGTTTSEHEYNEALAAGQSLRKAVDSYAYCDSFIYSVALLNESTYTQYDYALVEYLMGTSPKAFITDLTGGSYYYSIRGGVYLSDYWADAVAYSNAYFAIKSGDADEVKQQLNDVFKQIAYTTVPDQYLTGTLVDTIPANFKLTAESASALKSDGWTVTENTDGTTTISKSGVVADNKAKEKDLTYEVVYQGGGYGAVYTNTYAQYTYTDILTGKEVVGAFVKPVVEVIPWTVNDHATAMLGTDLSMNITANDLFAELSAGGYTVVDYKIRLTDANGADATYYDAVEQLGCKFDALLDMSNQTVSFYTLTGGTHTFYYVAEATVKAPDGALETVYSRVTKVDVSVPNVDLTKTATEVTKDDTYAADVTKDEHGNVQQLYLITLKIAKQNASDTIKNGVLTDAIPEGFTFVRFVAPTSGVTHNDGVITYSGITGDKTLKFLVRYTGNNYGVLYTNKTASFAYDFVTEDGTLSLTQYFEQPVAGIAPATVNDVDIVKSGATQTIDVTANDLYTKDGMTLSDYSVSDKAVYITDENGKKLTQEQIDALGISLSLNGDGTLTYTAPERFGDGSAFAFYYVVEAKVTLPDGSTYAENNSTTLTSRPTKVTIYSVEDQYIVVDFGLPTAEKAYGVTKDVAVAENVSLTSLASVSGLQGSVQYGTMSTSNGKYSFCPTTMNFSDISNFNYTVKLDKRVYNTVARSVTGSVTVVPANNVYYEEYYKDVNFIHFVDTTVTAGDGNKYTSKWTNETTATTERTQAAHAEAIHGYDASYNVSETYSNNTEKSVTVTKDAYEADAYFTFSGTGFDIYSECSKNSGVIVAEIYQCASQEEITSDSRPVKVILMDTYLAGSVSYYQIPVIMCHDLDYNIYTVKLRAFYNIIFDHHLGEKATPSSVRTVLGLDAKTELICLDMSSVSLDGAQQSETRKADNAVEGQYNVYIDAVRIYNPLGTLNALSGIAYTAYGAANELNPTFENINDTILDVDNATEWANTASGVEGALYIASGSETAKETDVFDDQTVVCLGAAGTIKTVTENGKDYLLDKNGKYIQYEGANVYVVSVTQNTDDPNAEQAGIAFYYDNQSGDAIQLNRGQLSKLNIYCYENKYEAIGPENEVYLRNGQGLAFNVPQNAHIQISAKMPFNSGTNATVKIYAYYNGSWTANAVAEISSRTEMYYDLTNYVNSDNTLIIKCESSDSDAVLALCNVKGIGAKERMLSFNGNTFVAAMNAFYPTEEEHTHSYTEEVTEPTCTEQGYTTHTCKCGDNFVDSYVDALGHAWDKGVVTIEPTATEDGVRTFTCERCGETKTEVIEATAETPVDPTDPDEPSVPEDPSEDEKPEEKPCDGGKNCPSAQFSDVNVKEWYHESVDYVVTHDLMNGVTGGKFDPEGEMNRAMLVTVLWRYEGKPTGAKNTFSDVPADEWYTDAVAWAAENGIVNGIGDGKFDPLGKITREQLATILYRYTEKRGIADTSKRGDLNGFPDEKQISAYATDAVAWAVGEGLILGSEGMLLPQGNATRAQVATILMRYIENIAK